MILTLILLRRGDRFLAKIKPITNGAMIMGDGFVILLIGCAFFLGYLLGRYRKFSRKSPLDQIPSFRTTTTPLAIEERQAIQQLLQQNKKIEAIKRYRQITGCGLKEAKAAIDQIQAE